MVHEEEVQDSAYPGYDFTTVEGNRAKLAKGKGAWGGGGGCPEETRCKLPRASP